MLPTRSEQVCVVLGTGGTIAGRAAEASDGVGYKAGEVGVDALVAGVPALQGAPLAWEQVAQVDSKDMGFPIWQQLAQRVAFHLERPEVGSVLITHGTDTLEETAYFLHSVLRPTKPVVMTCAMRPASALVPDGPQNLADAYAVATHPGARGVVVVCAGWVYGAVDVVKAHTYRTDAFDGGDAGPLGRVAEGLVEAFRAWPGGVSSGVVDRERLALIAAAQQLPSVVLLLSHADTDGRLVRALLASPPEELPLYGVVVAGTGNATVHEHLEAALLQAEAQGLAVVRCSRCWRGPVITHGGQRLRRATGLAPTKARVALALEGLGIDGLWSTRAG